MPSGVSFIMRKYTRNVRVLKVIGTPRKRPLHGDLKFPRQCLTHIQVSAARAVQKVMRSKRSRVVRREALKPGTKVWVFYKTSKQNDPVRWVSASVVEEEEHIVRCRRSNRGAPMSVAYEHIRIAPSGVLAQELVECSLEYVLESQGDGCDGDQDSIDDQGPENPECHNDDTAEACLREVFGDDDELENESIPRWASRSFFTAMLLETLYGILESRALRDRTYLMMRHLTWRVRKVRRWMSFTLPLEINKYHMEKLSLRPRGSWIKRFGKNWTTTGVVDTRK